MKPTREELQAYVELLVKKRRSIRLKAQALPEGSLVTRGKVLKLGASLSFKPGGVKPNWDSLPAFSNIGDPKSYN